MAVNRARLINGKWYTDAENPLGISPPDKYESNRPGFQDQAEMVAAMKDERYQTDEGYRQHVAKMISESDAVEIGLESRGYSDNGDQVDAVHDYIKQVFGHPLYKTSPLYRAQVAAAIAADPTVDQMFVQPLGGVNRFQVEPEITGPEAPAPKPRYNPDDQSDSEE